MENLNVKELIDEIQTAAFEVRRTLGRGFLESVYRNALEYELSLRNIKSSAEFAIPVYYKSKLVGGFRADLIVENCIIIELKCCSTIAPAHEAQLVNYLNATGVDNGIVINYGDQYGFRHKTRIYDRP